MSETVSMSVADATALVERACMAAGASPDTARALTDATLSAARHGQAVVGFPHLVDYLKSSVEGRINGNARPALSAAFPAFLVSDADGGIAQLGFANAFETLVSAARSFGVAVLAQRNSYTTGELGFYVRKLAGQGLVAIAATNANAMMASHAGGSKVYSTNPLAFGFPLGDDAPPLVIDQSSSATAYINVVSAADAGQPIPDGWAVDETGADTKDAVRALRGALLPFGGRRGANIALIVEMLAAGLSGGNWSLDAPDFASGSESPAIGLTVIAIRPGSTEADHVGRARAQTARLAELGVHLPGVTGRATATREQQDVTMPLSVFEAISRYAAG